MSFFALLLILAAAFAHATWNVLLKRAGGKGPSGPSSGTQGPLFLWLGGVISAGIWAPLAVYVAIRSDTPLHTMLGAIAVSGSFHLTYFLMLQAGYRAGDLSLVYPLARGTGPAVSVVAALVIRHEHPPVIALAGAAIIVGGLLSLARGSSAGAGRAAMFGVGTGIVIACYTLWDKHAVDDLAVAAVTLSWGTEAMRAALLTPLALRHRAEVAAIVREHLRDAIGFAVLSPLAYILVLIALARTDVAFVAPAREVSIVIGVVLGRIVLHEAVDRRRVASAALVAGGVVLLALG